MRFYRKNSFFASSYSCYLRLSFPGNVSDDLTAFIPIYPNGLPTVPKLPRSSRAGSLRNPGFLYIKKFCDFESFTSFSLVRFQEVTCDRREERADKFADLSKTAVLGTVAFWLSGECCLPSKNHSLQGDFTPARMEDARAKTHKSNCVGFSAYLIGREKRRKTEVKRLP